MPTELEVAQLVNSVAQRVANSKATPHVLGRGYVAVVQGHRAEVRKNTRTSAPTPGFDVPAWLDLHIGDYVLFRELGSDRVILAPLDRNAAVDWNPLTTPGQIVIAGPDGTPSVIEPPDDPNLNYVLEWSAELNGPVWVAV